MCLSPSPQQLGLQRADLVARPRRFVLANDPPHAVGAGLGKRFFIEGRGPGQEFVQQHAQRVDIAAGVDVQAAHFGLLGTHIQRRADHRREPGVQRPLGQFLVQEE